MAAGARFISCLPTIESALLVPRSFGLRTRWTPWTEWTEWTGWTTRRPRSFSNSVKNRQSAIRNPQSLWSAHRHLPLKRKCFLIVRIDVHGGGGILTRLSQIAALQEDAN